MPKLAPLQTHLALTIALITLLLTFLLSAAVGTLAARQVEQDVHNSLKQLAYQLSLTLDRGMHERYRELQVISTLEVIRQPSANPRFQRALLDKLQVTYPAYAWIGLTDPDGRVRVATGALLEGANVSARPWFQQGKQRASVSDVHEALLLAKHIASHDGSPPRFVDVSTPVYDLQGRFVGVLGSHLSWSWAQNAQRALLESTPREHHVEALVLAQDGTVLLGPSALVGRAYPQPPGSGDRWTADAVERLDGQEYLVGHSATRGHLDYPGLGWQVLVRENKQTALAPVRALQQRIVLLGILAAVAFTLLGVLAAGYLARPLRLMSVAANRLRSGEGVQIPVTRHYTEAAVLSLALRELLDERDRQRQEMQELNATLEQRVAQRTEELERINEELDAFSYSVSHDLRTPLRHVSGFAEMLEKRLGETDDGTARRYLSVIRSSTIRMNQLIDDLLAFSRLSREQLNVTAVDLNELVETVILELEPDMVGRDVDWRVSVLPVVRGDKALLKAVMTNLLSNALKYSGKRDRAVIEVRAEEGAEAVVVTVRDNGVGFDPKYADKLFGVFQRLHRADEFEGTGIGLANVRRIVERHGGRVWAHSQPGQGAAFSFSLPDS
ncbi:sensor histidine kinase [Deinococcus peraridilitoris]|uniref:histidine kinase n=1 Tax=Deinococcus peraridilitoris (strain DSM 19664 / LMG 22246 / CIP 109416 / KR-200) TaxID=937777 RepID=L0A7W7_DEIPD|nr:ATP-binding protein [Deinococcus peraridilitoris]AFZ69277.1 bacteriophytochrome (light-regulated signal transduction histidine kinase) [Deinococcus peraridilitoris DSM 19664]